MFEFNDNVLEFSRAEHPIFRKDGQKDDLRIKINGFSKRLNKLDVDDKGLIIEFKNG